MPATKRLAQTAEAISYTRSIDRGKLTEYLGRGEPSVKKQKMSADFLVPDYLQSSILSTPIAFDNNTLQINFQQVATKPEQQTNFCSLGQQSTKQSGKSGKSDDNSIFESDKHVIQKLCRELIEASGNDLVYKTLFRQSTTRLKHKTAYKDATLEQKRYLIRNVDHDIKLEISASDFVVPQSISGPLGSPDLKDKEIKFMILEAKRDLRHIYPVHLQNFNAEVIRLAQRNRTITAKEQIHSISRHLSRSAQVSQPRRPDLSFLKEIEPNRSKLYRDTRNLAAEVEGCQGRPSAANQDIDSSHAI